MSNKLDKNPAIAPRIRGSFESRSKILVGRRRPTSPAPAAAARAALSKTLLAFALCASCATDPPTSTDAPLVQCGAPPLQPGVTVAFDGQGNATMSVATYNAITKYMDDASAWMTCRQMNP